MSKDKQIEEIKDCIDSLYGCDCAYYGVDGIAIATILHEAGYRKASEFTEEIFAEIEESLHNLAQLYLNCGLNDNFGICYSIYEQAVLPIKKKYTENKDIKSIYKHYTNTGATYITSEPQESENNDV